MVHRELKSGSAMIALKVGFLIHSPGFVVASVNKSCRLRLTDAGTPGLYEYRFNMLLEWSVKSQKSLTNGLSIRLTYRSCAGGFFSLTGDYRRGTVRR